MKELFIYTRTVELLVCILVGAFLCWLGYRLFFKGLSDKSDLNVEYGKIKFRIFRASPGIFFSLFGAVIVASSVWNVAKYQEEVVSSDALKTKTIIEKGSGEGANCTIRNFEDIRVTFKTAHALHSRGDLAHAEALYKCILIAIPELEKVTNNLADLYLVNGHLDTARVYARFSMETYPDFEDARKTMKQLSSNE
jgi:hypothetical protein